MKVGPPLIPCPYCSPELVVRDGPDVWALCGEHALAEYDATRTPAMIAADDQAWAAADAAGRCALCGRARFTIRVAGRPMCARCLGVR